MSVQSPLLRIRAGIEAGNPVEVIAGVQEAKDLGVVIAPNVQDMITQWLAVNGPQDVPKQPPEQQALAVQGAATTDAPKLGSTGAAENIQMGSGVSNWVAREREGYTGPSLKPTPEVLRTALLRFFEGAPKGSDAAAGLGIKECEDGARFFPLPMLGKAVGLSNNDEDEISEIVLGCIREAPKGVFVLSGYGVGLCEWAGWDEFNSALAAIVAATRDPAFEPRSIQQSVIRTARGAVRSGHVRQAQVLTALQESLSPQAMPEDAAPALRSAISRRTRLALACVVDAIASQGLGPEAGPDSMGLVGQLPRALFGHIFENVDDRDRGACAFLGEVLQSWDRRRCFSKRWLQDAASKFSTPKGQNLERDEGRGWYALTAENLHKSMAEAVLRPATTKPTADTPLPQEPEKSKSQSRDRQASSPRSRSPRRSGSAGARGDEANKDQDPKLAGTVVIDVDGKRKKRGVQRDEEDDETVQKHLEESRKRRAALMAKYSA